MGKKLTFFSKIRPALLLPLGVCGTLTACNVPNIAGGESCGTEVLSTQSNPENGKNNFSGMKAQVVRINCGATVDWMTAVRLVDLNDKPLYGEDGAVFSYYHGKPTVTTSWKNSNHLEISCPDCDAENITLKTVKRNFINIEYTQ